MSGGSKNKSAIPPKRDIPDLPVKPPLGSPPETFLPGGTPLVGGIPRGGHPFPPFAPLPTGRSYDQSRRAMHDQFGEAMSYLRGMKQNLAQAQKVAAQPPQQPTVQQPSDIAEIKEMSGFNDAVVESNIRDLMRRGMSRKQAIEVLKTVWVSPSAPGGGGDGAPGGPSGGPSGGGGVGPGDAGQGGGGVGPGGGGVY